jgi:hypothetical protein
MTRSPDFRDDADALALAIEQLISDPQRRAVAEAKRVRAEHMLGRKVRQPAPVKPPTYDS